MFARTEKSLFWAFIHLFFPRLCAVCGDVLQDGEEGICIRCNMDMPRTNLHRYKNNFMKQRLKDKMPLERAASYFFYRKESNYRKILYKMKYEGRKRLAVTMGRYMAAELKESDFFRGIDVILPVPLHPFKQKQRSYNQSEYLAQGISEVTGIEVDTTSVIRVKYTDTQTRKSPYARWRNVTDIFQLRCPERFVGKHVLIVDDVLTTGATISACAEALGEVKDLSISVLTLAVV